jgi:hypothetical protein
MSDGFRQRTVTMDHGRGLRCVRAMFYIRPEGVVGGEPYVSLHLWERAIMPGKHEKCGDGTRQ